MSPRVRPSTSCRPAARRTPLRRLLRRLSGLLLVVALSACAVAPGSDPLTGTDRGSSCVPARASTAPVELAPSLVPGLTVDSWADEQAHAALSTPVLPGLGVLNERLRLAAAQALERYRGQLADQSDSGELNVSWTLVGASERSVGVLLQTQQTVGSRRSSLGQVYWLERGDQRLLEPVDLFTVQGFAALRKHVARDLCVGSSERATAIASALAQPSGDGVSVTFGSDGNLVLTAIPGPDDRPQTVVVGAGTAAPWLSLPGQAALEASVHPQRLPVIGPSTGTRPSAPSQAQPDVKAQPDTKPRRVAKARPVAKANRARSRPKPRPPHGRATRPRTVDCRKARCVALTFDDGPGPYTTRLVAELRRANAPATFFLMGEHVAAMPAVARQVAAAGFEIGNHTWSHPDLTRRGSREDADQLSRTSAVIRWATGRQPRLMRPPYGARNARVDRVARQQGLAEVLWSVDTLDWKHRNVRAVQDAVRQRVRRGSIVLLHDIHPTTVEAMPGIIAQLRRSGYTLVTVSQLLGPLRPGTRRFSAG